MTDRRVDIPALEVLVAVADAGSLSAAAALLGLAQPNASRQLARLERRLGARLFDRGARGSTPTEAGRVAIEHARRVLDASDALVENVHSAAGAGRIRVIASQTLAEHHMPRFLAALAVDLPDAPVSFEVGNSAGVVEALRRGRADIGFVEGIEVPEGLSFRVVGRDRLVAVVAPEHPWAGRDTVTGDELAASRLVLREEGSGTREALARALAPRALAAPALVVHSNTAVRAAVAGGRGCAVMSELAAAPAVAAGVLTAVPIDVPGTGRVLHAVWVGSLPTRLEHPLHAITQVAVD